MTTTTELNTTTNTELTAMLEAALDLAAAGWRVLPCLERDRGTVKAKAPDGRLVPHGSDNASSDREVVRGWWTAHPDRMIGAVVPDTLLVLDIDPRNGGSLAELEAVLGPLPATLTAWSGRGDGGHHRYYLRPGGELSRHRLPTGIDLKTSGYCIVPPSVHPATGQPYRWEHRPPARLPSAAVDALRPPVRPRHIVRRGSGDGSHLVAFLHRFPDHGINAALYWAAGTAAAEGILDAIVDELVDTAVELGESERQARRTVESAAKSRRAAGGAA